MVQKKENTIGMNTMMGPKDLVIILNKGLPEENLEKDKCTKEKGEISKSRNLAKTKNVSCGGIDKFDLKKEEEVENLHMEPKEIMNSETI
ncbi:14473_t:CDS:2, partial [Gigaspora margarita]